jgi:hypothetical protein
MKQLIFLSVWLLLCASALAAVGFDAGMTTGNGASGQYQYVSSASASISSTGLTIGASATLLIGVLACDHNPAISSPAMTWNSVTMNAGPTLTNGVLVIAVFYLVSPATGNKTLAASWTTNSTCYMSAASFTGTDTTTGIKVADNNTTSTESSIAITSDSNGATIAFEIDTSSASPSPNFNKLYLAQNLTPNSSGSYELGGTSNSHTFGSLNGSWAAAGVHIIAPATTATRRRVMVIER